jgi:ribosomal protein S18 acetylase RimI-like enzyme
LARPSDNVQNPDTNMNIDPSLRLTVEPAASEEDRATIERGLMEHARLLGIDATEQERIALCLRNSNRVLVGGLVGGTMWGWLEVRLLWVHETFRCNGHGTTLLDAAENEAILRGCHHARLETFNPEARGFYERRGYEQYAAVPDYPVGHTRWLLMKTLKRADAIAPGRDVSR